MESEQLEGLDYLIEGAQCFLVISLVGDSLQVSVVAALFVSVEEVVGKASLVRQSIIQCVEDVEVFLSPDNNRKKWQEIDNKRLFC